MSTPQFCPGCGNRCSLDSPSCSTGEAYLRSLRQARKKKAAAKAAAASPQTAPATVPPAIDPVPVSSAPESAPKAVRKAAPAQSGAGPRARKSGARTAPAKSAGKRSASPRPVAPTPAEVYASLSQQDRLAYQMRSLARRMAQNQPREKSGQGRILSLLDQRGELTQRQLTALAGIRSSSLSELLGKLEGAGLVVRSACPTDHRTTLVSLTEQGRRQARQNRTQAESDPFGALSQQEQGQLLSLLEKLNREQQ